ncbi:MAG: chorismate lyase, partial [Colwellia sp.]
SKLALQLELPPRKELWGRRSTFMLHDKPLMVAEVFLPNAFAYQPDILKKTQSIKEES